MSGNDERDEFPEEFIALRSIARNMRERAHAPYSGFRVGAAVRGESGAVYGGCNVENASYGLTVCAERVAIFAAVANGEPSIKAVAVVADADGPVRPCGACRQVIAEFAPDETPVLCSNTSGAHGFTTVGALLPHAFRFKRPDAPAE